MTTSEDDLPSSDSPPVPSVLRPVQLRNASSLIADRLITAIALGLYVPGQRLPTERELADMLKVSRATVHDALQLVAAAGHVDIRRGRSGGAYVTEGWSAQSAEVIQRTLAPTWSALESLLDFRQLIEGLIARTAATRRSENDITAIQSALKDYQDAGADREASRAADHRLHLAIANSARNPHLVRLSAQTREQVNLGFDAEPYTPAVRARALRQHTALVEAIADGEATRAGRLASDHFELTATALRHLFLQVQSSRDAGAAPPP